MREQLMSGPLPEPGDRSTAGGHVPKRGWLIPVCATLLFLAGKLLLVRRINVNWDEFWYLAHVHALIRGELGTVFQMPYTHLFSWLVSIHGDEMAEIIAARWLMVALLAVTVALLVKLAYRWASAPAAWIAALCYLVASPVTTHGGSFRSDSLLAPLTLATLLLTTSRSNSLQARVAAGICFGLALAVSLKAAFLLPMLIVLELVHAARARSGLSNIVWEATRSLLLICVAAALVSVTILMLHAWSLPALVDADAQTFATTTIHKTMLDVPFVPRWDYLRITLGMDKATWALIAIGAVVAFKQRRWEVLACALSLAPLLIYRNAFPYYYVVMLAPACVLAAITVDASLKVARRSAGASHAAWLPAMVCMPLALQGALRVQWLSADEQRAERATIAGVHEVFPSPVPYLDHSGMIASFPKVNFFMSTWGVENYRERGASFMREALARYRPPLLLVNRDELELGSPQFRSLLVEDQMLIQQSYVPYWGPIWVAGTHAQVPPNATVTARLPFPGGYRLESDASLLVDGVRRSSGDTFDLAGETCVLSLIDGASSVSPANVRLVWAGARPAPTQTPPLTALYTAF